MLQRDTDMEQQLPIFLGVCHKALFRFGGLVQDLYGVTDYLGVHFFPQSLGDLFLLLAMPKVLLCTKEPVRIILRDCRTHDQASHDIDIVTGTIEDDRVPINPARVDKPYTKDPETKRYTGSHMMISQSNSYKMVPFPCPDLFLTQPTEVGLYLNRGKHERKLGSITCQFVPPSPMTQAERNALMSRPDAIKVVVIRVTCNKCKDAASFYMPLDGVSGPPKDQADSIPIAEAPNMWSCACEQHRIPLDYLKQGMHTLFRGQPSSRAKKRLGMMPLYEKSSILSMLSEYQVMLTEKAEEKEEVFQKYLQEHPLFWNFLAPIRIWHKPPVLTKYNADFAILTRMKVLYFVEIEKPKTTLIKSNGGVHSELQAALDQVRDWKIEADKRREAILAGLKLEQKDVHDIRYIVVAGLASKTGTSGIEKIRKMKTDADSIFCFDELASFVNSTVSALGEL